MQKTKKVAKVLRFSTVVLFYNEVGAGAIRKISSFYLCNLKVKGKYAVSHTLYL